MGTRIRKYAILGFIFLLAGCYRHHLYVQQEWVDANFLASSHVGSPDPRKAEPPEGQRLLIAWDFPRSVFQRSLTLTADVRFWDDTQKSISFPLTKKRGYHACFFPKEKILTYRVRVFERDGRLIETWQHHFWTELIEVGSKEASRSSSSVSSQPMQESVKDTP
jgi:hypothetical protein